MTQKIMMIWSHNEKGPKTCRCVSFEKNSGSDKTYKMTSKQAFFSKESIVYH